MTHIPTVICGCGHEMVREKNGITLKGIVVQKDSQVPYYKISSDRFACKNCLATVYLPAKVPLAFHHEKEFELVQHDKVFVFA